MDQGVLEGGTCIAHADDTGDKALVDEPNSSYKQGVHTALYVVTRTYFYQDSILNVPDYQSTSVVASAITTPSSTL